MKKINHEYGTDLKSKYDSVEKIHFIEDCICYLGIKDEKFSIVCNFHDFHNTLKINQKLLVEYEFESKEECLKFIKEIMFVTPYHNNDIKFPEALR